MDSCENSAFRTKQSAIAFFILLGIILLFILFPIFWMIITSLKPNSEAMAIPPKFIFEPTLNNFRTILGNLSFSKSFINSLIIASSVTLLTLFCASTSSYAFTRFRMFGGNILSNLILITRMIPGIVLGLPIYFVANKLHLIDTYFIMVIAITTFALPFQIWMLLGFFAQIPLSLDESARIDGCSWYMTFYRIILPTAAPGLAATAIMTFCFSWNDLFFSLILTRQNIKTAPLAILEYMGMRTFDWAAIMASGALLMIPTLLISFLFQKHMVKGLTAGAIKG